MKGAVSTIVLLIIVAVIVLAVVYNYYKPTESVLKPTGKAVTPSISEGGNLGYLESCNPNKDRCDAGLVCKLGRDNIYRCLR